MLSAFTLDYDQVQRTSALVHHCSSGHCSNQNLSFVVRELCGFMGAQGMEVFEPIN